MSNTYKLESWSLKNEIGTETIFEKITKDIIPQIQQTQQTMCRINKKKSTPIAEKQSQKENSEGRWRKRHVTSKEQLRLTA